MKNHKIFNIAAGVALAVGLTACSSDYLDLKPQGTLEYDDVLTNSQGATLAVHGMCNSMYKQYSALYDYNWFNGEPWLSMYYGEVMGQDYISLFWFRSYPELVNWTQMELYNGSYGATIAWSYCYGLISQANNLITFTPKELDENGEVKLDAHGNPIPDFSNDENPREYAFRYAQALTFRAHAYTRLMQIYAPRWEDRIADGEELGTVPLRLEFVDPEGNLDCPLSPMSVVMDQIYADLYQAIDLYKESGYGRTYQWEPDLKVCQGLFARAALVKNDYKTAQAMAHDARQGYPIMSIQEYNAGFAEPNGEWMWTNSGEAQGLYYASFGATYACNGAYPCLWGSIGAGAINVDLANATKVRDIRTRLYYVPRNAGVKESNFWSTSGCETRTLNINAASGTIHKDFVEFCEAKYSAVNQNWYPPYTYQGYPLNENNTVVTAQFGAQFKFWGTDGYSSSFFPFMRASEMLLIEAEAAWWNKDYKTANSCLEELETKRIGRIDNETGEFTPSEYEDYSGDELLEAVKLNRRIELWGEGFNWFDYKRWEEDIVRRAWSANNTSSGNWPFSVSGVYGVHDLRWRWRIPSSEYNYNHAIDQDYATENGGSDESGEESQD